MKLQQVAANITGSGGVTPWLKLDYYENPFDLGVLVSQDTGGANTLALNYILDASQQDTVRSVMVSQSTTTITITDSGPPLSAIAGGGLGHGLAVGDAVFLSGTPRGVVDGTYSVTTVTNATTYTLTSAVSQTLAGVMATVTSGRVMLAGSTNDHVIGTAGAGIAARAAFGITVPIWGLQLICTTFSAAAVARLVTVQGGR